MVFLCHQRELPGAGHRFKRSRQPYRERKALPPSTTTVLVKLTCLGDPGCHQKAETAMMSDDLAQWGDDVEVFHARFARFFERSEPRQQAVKYMRGLTSPVQRKNSWQLAEAAGDETPDKMQRLLHRSNWDADGVRDDVQAFVVECFGEAAGIGVVDETGFIKKGTHSVGVQRQYNGTAGKIENSQIGAFLTYRSNRGHAFLDRRLCLPKEWCAAMSAHLTRSVLVLLLGHAVL
jgi:DDE superfamily endonuclease